MIIVTTEGAFTVPTPLVTQLVARLGRDKVADLLKSDPAALKAAFIAERERPLICVHRGATGGYCGRRVPPSEWDTETPYCLEHQLNNRHCDDEMIPF